MNPRAAYHRKWKNEKYAADPVFREAVKDRSRKRFRDMSESDKDVWRDKNLRKKYGIGLADKRAMFAAQGGACAICSKHLGGNRDTFVDHDHKTGRVRQLLCNNCNMLLGLSGDNPARLRRAAEYIVRWWAIDDFEKAAA